MPNGAFYGAKKACQPLHLLYHYHEKSVYAANDYLEPRRNLRASIRILNLRGRDVLKKEMDFDIGANSSMRLMELSTLPSREPVYFLDLRLEDEAGRIVSHNFYWLSTRKDVMDYPASTWFVTPIKEFADFRELASLPHVELQVQSNFEQAGPESKVRVSLSNPSDAVAFFVEARLVKKRSGESVLPVYWEDNYVTLLPGESRTLAASFVLQDLDGEEPAVTVSGWNVEGQMFLPVQNTQGGSEGRRAR